MLTASKDKRPLKSFVKSSQKLQPVNGNEQLTVRINKSTRKILRPQKIARSPEIIKLMIEELEKQLMAKTKSKNIGHEVDLEIGKTKRKFKKNQNLEINMKNTRPSQSKMWKSPTKKKTAKHQEQFFQSTLEKTVQKSFPKISPSHQTNQQMKTKKPVKPYVQAKQGQRKQQSRTQSYIFVENDLIKFSNLELPLFIVEKNSSQLLDKSQHFSLKNDNKSVIIDEKQGFMRHSKVLSFDSVNEKTNRHVNYIERSFCEQEQSEDEQFNSDNVSFLRLNLFEKKEQIFYVQQHTNRNVGNASLGSKNNTGQSAKININQLIQLNNSVLRIQKWWRTKKPSLGSKKCIQKRQKNQQQGKKESLETIQTKQEESQKDINPFSNPTNNQEHPPSLSQKSIPSHSPSASDPNDVLHLRQTAAHIQYSTHEQILKQLHSKGRITEEQFKEQLEVIKGNLEGELRDVERIRGILRESAEKVERVMERARRDIMRVKESDRKEDILETIFGKNEAKATITSEQGTSNNSPLPIIFPQPSAFLKVYKRIKIPTYQTQLQQFCNQKSSDEQNSFLSHQNAKLFNSPNTNSENNLNSPNSNDGTSEENIISSSQNLEEEIFSCQIGSSTSVNAHQSSTQPSFCMTANFQQLYKGTFEFIPYRLPNPIADQKANLNSDLKTIGRAFFINPPTTIVTNQHQHINCRHPQVFTQLLQVLLMYLSMIYNPIDYHKNEFLTYMNMPYGESVQTRLMKNRMKDPEYQLQDWTKTIFYTQDGEEIVYGLKQVIDEKLLDQFFDSYYEETDIQFTQTQKMNIQLEKIHNRAVFHAFNHALNFFRPYYNIGGAPYLWCSSEKSLTFFCIGQDNIQEVYEKTQMKILKTSSHLCGVITDVPHRNGVVIEKFPAEECIQIKSPFRVMQNQGNLKRQDSQKTVRKVKNFDEFFNYYTDNFNPAYLANLEERLKKKELAQTQEENVEWFGNTFEQGKVSTLLNLTELIEEIILLEECSILQNIQQQRNQQKTFLSDEVF